MTLQGMYGEIVRRLRACMQVRGLGWPIVGGMLGFALFFIMLGCGVTIPLNKFPDTLREVVILMVGTFVGGWAGGVAAFKAERETQELNRRAERIAAANKAIFTILMLYEVYENLRQHCIDTEAVRKAADRVLNIDSPQPGMMKDIEFHFDELDFLLELPEEVGAAVMRKLMFFQWQYGILVQTVEQRAKAFEDLYRARHANPVVNADESHIRHLFPAEYRKLEALTNQMIDLVNEGISEAKTIDSKLREVLQQQFPKHVFLKINFR